MINLNLLKKYPFAEKCLLDSEGLNIKTFPKLMLRKFLKEISVDDIKHLNKIYQWKEQVEQGLDTPFPFNDLNLKQPKSFKNETLWETVGAVCIISIIAFFIIIGFFIWGDLKLLNDYHFLVVPFIICIICLSIRFFIHITVVKYVRFIEQVFPYAAKKLNLNSENAARCLTDIDDFIYGYDCPDMSYLLLLNSTLSIFYSLLKRAISLYPDKILLYYQYGEHNSTVIRWSERPKFKNIFRLTYEKYDYRYINIFDVLLNIDESNSLEFLLSILSKSKIENIKITALRDDIVHFFNRNKHYLLKEGYLFGSLHFLEMNFFEKNPFSYKFCKDWRFKIYAYVLLPLLPICLLFYPFYFRYNYVYNELAENKYQMLLNDYQANCKLLYDLEAVKLVVSVSNHIVYNNHVGHSWGTSNLINGTNIGDNKTTISYHYGDPISLYTEIVEYDNWSDVSCNTETISCSKEELINGVNVSVDSYVYENRGRYSGNCAKWTSTYHLEVEKPNKPAYQNIKISSSEVLSHFFDGF